MAYADHKPQRRSSDDSDLFTQLFSERSVILELCKERAKLAKKRNDKQFLHRISKRISPVNSQDLEFEVMFPSRRKWHSYRPGKRDASSSYELNTKGLFRAVLRLRVLEQHETWAVRIKEQVDRIRGRVFSEEKFVFSAPKIHPIEKEKGGHKYGPLAVFPLDDKIIDCLTARYLRRTLDGALRDSCLAFRCGKDGNRPPTIHDALLQLLNVNRRHRNAGLYVAECDIKSFYDCVAHSVARNALSDLMLDAKRRNQELRVDSRALAIYDAYLRAYSFQRNVKSRQESLLANKDALGEFSSPGNELQQCHGVTAPDDVGVPQGGAISCFIANVVLHDADKKLDRLKRKGSFRYLRYCDDMILLASELKVCERAYACYSDALNANLLPMHKAMPVVKYAATFWKGKSKAPYFWGRDDRDEAVPWIQFVGYQVRYDGLVRVRPSSLKKQKQKMTEVADDLLSALNPGRRRRGPIPPFAIELRKSNNQITHRLRQKLMSMTVGRVRLGTSSEGPRPMCWANGFKGLWGRRTIPESLKVLDRHRERQVRRIIKRPSARPKHKSKKSDAKNVLPYYGSPFSFLAQFRRR
jgi:hypothetical protein